MNPSRLSAYFKKGSQMIGAIRATLVSGLLGGNLAALLLLHRPRAALSYVQYGLFGWRMIHRQGLPRRQFHELFRVPEHLSVNLLPTTGYLTYWDANYAKDVLYLALLARVLSPRAVFEIGTLYGHTALLFALNTPPDAVVYTLDLPPDGSSSPSLPTTIIDDAHILAYARSSDEHLYLSHPAGRKVRQLYGDSAQFDFTPYHEKVDVFFVDGAHGYEYVRSDSLNALACTRRGGVIVWHDYGRWGVNGVSRWLHQLARTGRDLCRLPGSSLAILKV
jgi:predicted O-methyltransferase YrrM